MRKLAEKITNHRYANVTLIIAGSKEAPIQIMMKLDKTSEKYSMTINKKRSEMVIFHCNRMNIKEIEGFEDFERVVFLALL